MVKRKAPSTSATHAADPKATVKRAKTSTASSQSNSASATANSSACRARQPSVTTEEEDDERIVNESDEVVEIDLDGNEMMYHANAERNSQVDEDEEPEDDKTELAYMMECWTSPVYAFYGTKPVIDHSRGRKAYTFICQAKGCSKKINCFLDTKDAQSTSNMCKHIQKCWGEEVLAAADDCKKASKAREQVVKGFLKTGSIVQAFGRTEKGTVSYSHRQHIKVETRVEIVRWVSESLRPFNIVKDHGFNSLMKTGRPGYHIPLPSTILRDVKLVFANSRNRISKLLREYDGELHFATDAWTSPNHHAFVAFTVHFLYEGEPVSLLLDFLEVPKSHTGLNLTEAFAKVLREFGIEEKLLGLTCDNASSNAVMVDELEAIFPGFDDNATRVRCFAHTTNLVAKSLLKQFDVPKGKSDNVLTTAERDLQELAEGLKLEDMEVRMQAVLNGEVEDGDGEEGLVDEMTVMSASKRLDFHHAVMPVQVVLVKLRKFAYKMIHSTTKILPAWRAIVAEKNLADRLMPHDVSTRWNSTYNMLVFAVDYQRAIRALVADDEYDLQQYMMSANKWKIVQQLRDVLKVFRDAMEFFSRSVPNLANVIPVMDYINEWFATDAIDEKYSVAIHASLSVAKCTLNHYYNLTDDSHVYRIAMILHPAYKLKYFHDHDWEPEWIETARQLVCDGWDHSYASVKLEADEIEEAKGPAKPSQNMFDNMASISGPTHAPQDELTRYLTAATENVPDLILWWKTHKSLYPRLYRMAIDYLMIPATSVAVEWLFSRGRILIPHLCNRLSPQTIHALLCLGEWSLLGFVRDSDIIKVAQMDDVEDRDGDDYEMEEGWDAIDLS